MVILLVFLDNAYDWSTIKCPLHVDKAQTGQKLANRNKSKAVTFSCLGKHTDTHNNHLSN